jgi:hypothetical protein
MDAPPKKTYLQGFAIVAAMWVDGGLNGLQVNAKGLQLLIFRIKI